MSTSQTDTTQIQGVIETKTCMPRNWAVYKKQIPRNIQTETESRRNRNSKQMDCHKGTESVMKSFPPWQRSGPDGFPGEFYQTPRGLNTSPSQMVPTEEEGTFPESFYETSITLIPKPDKDPEKNITSRYP